MSLPKQITDAMQLIVRGLPGLKLEKHDLEFIRAFGFELVKTADKVHARGPGSSEQQSEGKP